jgi:hypothetical protein
MTDEITISKTLRIRDFYDENWLQEQIAANPSILGLRHAALSLCVFAPPRLCVK